MSEQRTARILDGNNIIVSIFSRIDSQSLLITRKLLEKHASPLSQALPAQSQSRYPVDEVTIELDLDTINGIIKELTGIGTTWLEDTANDSHQERKMIMAYLIKQWIRIGEEAGQITQTNINTIH